MKTIFKMPFPQKQLVKPYCFLFYCLLLASLTTSCKKYLDEKSNKSLEVPSDLQDFQAILDYQIMNNYYPIAGDVASDDYYLTPTSWTGLTINYRNTYVWDSNSANDLDWQDSYKAIEDANVVLDGLKTLSIAPVDQGTATNIKASAYFYRGYAFYQLANVYALPYNAQTSQSDLGIPLKLSSDITAKTVRSTIAATYSQIISDLKTAANLLPVTQLFKTRPNRQAAYGALARTYLVMGDYNNANLYADSCLQLYNQLIDYNTLSPTAANPLSLFNAEVIFEAADYGASSLSPAKAMVDTTLYQSYNANDLRKSIFYKAGTNGNHSFKGDYSGKNIGAPFNGLAVDEILLIRSETYARLGNVTGAINDLNTLLSSRFLKGTYVPYSTALTADNALQTILQERRRELAFRSEIRWSDLRRLNQDARFAKTLIRNVNSTTYSLPPNDKRYAFLIPLSVVQISGIPQNNR